MEVIEIKPISSLKVQGPQFILAGTIKPQSVSQVSTQYVQDDGITYDEDGVTYDDARYAYGGLYGYKHYVPQAVFAIDTKSNIAFAGNSWTEGTPPGTVVLYEGMPMGPGFFLYITYPENGTVTL